MSTMPLRALLDSTDPYNLWRHCTRNQPWEDTALPTAMSRDNCRSSADHHWRPTVRHTAVTNTPVYTRPRVRRARTVGMGEVVVLVVAGLAVIGAGAVGRWVWGR